ncbi:MAG: hypothetical protein ACYC2G_12190 [Gemmatimonadaceae bacterium]
MRNERIDSGRALLAGRLMVRVVAMLGISVALGLGARTAFATPVYDECPYNEAQGQLGACISPDSCEGRCYATYGFEGGICTVAGCCLCPY